MVRSCGLLLYRLDPESGLSVWIAHMGGPFWARKPEASWSVPKGIADPGEADLDAALREFAEEIGHPAPDAPWRPLGEFPQASGKVIVIFTAEADFSIDVVRSNLFETEWPPRSGRMQQFPEIDDARWVTIDDARLKLVKGQLPVLDALIADLAAAERSES